MKSGEEVEGKLEALLALAQAQIAQVQDAQALEQFRVKFLGRKGELAACFSLLGQEGLTAEEKSRLGQRLNASKRKLEELLAARGREISFSGAGKAAGDDITLPGHPVRAGRAHPISTTIDEILEIFKRLGFSAVDGPEIETEYNNFEALNIPPEHPSRENFDTFYLESQAPRTEKFLLRSHTSPMQVRFMKEHKPPFRIVVPGRVFRPDAVDASHSFQFHQVEGLAVAPRLSFGDLKGILTVWARGMFGKQAQVRFRPHHFPFTEPSAEMDLSCIFCQGSGCRVCGKKGWLEILGCGMVHPEVFRHVGYPTGTVGFAFGMGVERIAMLTYGIDDIRLFFENDLRFLAQFP